MPIETLPSQLPSELPEKEPIPAEEAQEIWCFEQMDAVEIADRLYLFRGSLDSVQQLEKTETVLKPSRIPAKQRFGAGPVS